MEKQIGWIAGVLIALVAGFMGGYALRGNQVTEATPGMDHAMGGMISGLSGKTGDAFDKAFLAEMITHHEGAVVMAEAALKDAKHEEIRTMAGAIISAQTAEIKQMQDWLKEWYGN